MVCATDGAGWTFGDEPIFIRLDSRPGGIEAALNAILVALHRRAPADRLSVPPSQIGPLEALVLELTDLGIREIQPGVPRPSATARLSYRPADPKRPPVASPDTWTLVAPLGPIETEELRWYLEKYAVWPEWHEDKPRASLNQRVSIAVHAQKSACSALFLGVTVLADLLLREAPGLG